MTQYLSRFPSAPHIVFSSTVFANLARHLDPWEGSIACLAPSDPGLRSEHPRRAAGSLCHVCSPEMW
jgi:hypothetical protein